MAQLRQRADRAADRYQQRAQTRPLLALPLTFLARYTARQGMLLASAVAFRLFLWLLPLALLAAGVLSALAQHEGDSIESASRAAGVTGAASQQVETALREGGRSCWIAVLTGSVLFLWTTRTLIRNLTVVNAHAWAAPTPKPQQREVLKTTLLVALGWILLFVFAAFVAGLDGVFAGGVILAVVIQSVANVIVWFLVSRRLPDRRRRWQDLIPGCLLFGVGLAVMNAVSRVYLPARFAHSASVYGTLGIAGVILAWLLLIGQLLVVSCLVNSIWSDYCAERSPPT